MMSDDLIDRLAADLRPTPKRAVAWRLAAGLFGGTLVSLLLVMASLGLRPDLASAVGLTMFWVKLGYTLALAVVGLWACDRLARPLGSVRRRLAWLAAPVLILAGIAATRLLQLPSGERMPELMGHTAAVCPWLILGFSLPPLAGLVWAVRGLAPTRLRLTGLVLGLAAGGASATAYALHCNEMAAAFLVTWYSLGILAAGLLGWLLGPRLLRW